MPSCLGIYIESNLIKYAKVSKDRENVKLDAYGIKFYDNINEAVEQIINETFSFNIPISINTRDEKYNYFEMFSLLNEKDMAKAISTEFELLCEEKGYNKNTLDSRYILVNNREDRDKTKAMHISYSKPEISKASQLFQKYRLKAILPLPIAITNNIEIGVKENAAILNLEETCTLTTIIDGQINKVDVLEYGMEEIFEAINKKENSYAKAYDILKNTTIYTSEGRELEQENNYLPDIMPTLYNIVNTVKDNFSQRINNIEKLYITGTGAAINNIDLYFQEYLKNSKCEILKPYFTKSMTTNMSNIRDFIEVNSAIALGLQGLGEGIKTVNFKTVSTLEKLKGLGKIDINLGNKQGKKLFGGKVKLPSFKYDLNGDLLPQDIMLLRISGVIATIIIAYVIGSLIIAGMINQKASEVQAVISDTNAQIKKIDEDTEKINNKTVQYNSLIKKLEEINQKIADENSVKNSIPNLLSRIMVHVPKDVQVTEIKNTTQKHIAISVQAVEYDPIGYFIGAINNNGILVNAKSNSGTKQDGIIRITIEGDMP